MATSEWLRFFEDAGIPPGPALGYAVAFVDNRIHKNMLLDLTKELMKELGITVVGDIIAILRHAKVVHRQEMCRAASESLQPSEGGRAIDGDRSRDQLRDQPRDQLRDQPRDQLRDQTRDQLRDHHRDLSGAAGRMITKSLSRDPAPRSSRKPPGAGISVTVATGAAEAAVPEAPSVASKRRRVTAEMEGKYVITLPKGTTARSRKILQLQAARGLSRPSVFERLGAEAKAAAGKPSGVFSRLGDALDGADPVDPVDPVDPEALPYAGVLKKRRECSGSSGAAAAVPPLACGEAQDGAVSSSVPWGCGRVSSSSSSSSSSSCGAGSVFRRLGRKPD